MIQVRPERKNSSESPASIPPRPLRQATFWNRLLQGWIGEETSISRRVQVMIDLLICLISFTVAHLLRFDGWPYPPYDERFLDWLPYLLLARTGVNHLLGLYRRVWRYVSIPDVTQLAVAIGIVSAVLLALRILAANSLPRLAVPISVIIMDFVLTLVGMLAVRLSWRLTAERADRAEQSLPGVRLRTLLVGAGSAGISTVREIGRRTDLGFDVRGFLDDHESKQGTVIQGIPVLGRTEDLPRIANRYQIDQVIITMATARRKTIRRILDLCEQSQLPVRIIPALSELLGNQVTVSSLRQVEIEDLLGRDPIDIDEWLESNRAAYRGRRVLVTGAGGSIGRELCRQLLILEPASLLLLDKDENAVFEAERYLREQAASLLALNGGTHRTTIVPLICDLRHRARLSQIFTTQDPQVVFHAAAHKHVLLMEQNAAEAIDNNIGSTQVLLELVAANPPRFLPNPGKDEGPAGTWSRAGGVERCVLVSSDKAVNPTSIMGATKRVAELLFQAAANAQPGPGRTSFACVRFGNVLGSRGSVIPIFREQIRAGGPVTVTDPDVERYFMTIPEAAQLIIQAGALGDQGEIYLLDMGEPIRMVELAKDMIRLSGLTLGEDIEIVFTGLRQGEKRKEELMIAEEGAQRTPFGKIFIAPPLEYDFGRLSSQVAALTAAAEAGDHPRLYQLLEEMGIGFHPSKGTAPAALPRALKAGGAYSMTSDPPMTRGNHGYAKEDRS
ncbi:MAG: polysaccharide biosynthesis protein [Blastocatellia bacterium]